MKQRINTSSVSVVVAFVVEQTVHIATRHSEQMLTRRRVIFAISIIDVAFADRHPRKRALRPPVAFALHSSRRRAQATRRVAVRIVAHHPNPIAKRRHVCVIHLFRTHIFLMPVSDF